MQIFNVFEWFLSASQTLQIGMIRPLAIYIKT